MSHAQKAADEFIDQLFEATYGKEGKDRTAVILHRINRDLNPSYPRFIPVINLGPNYEDGIAPGEIGVTNKQKWSRYFKEIEVEMEKPSATEVEMPKESEEEPKPKAKAKRKEAQEA